MKPLEKYHKKLASLSMLHKNLALYRKSKKLTQDEMAVLLDLSKGKYRSYEYGLAEPSLKKSLEISQTLGINLTELLTKN